MIAGFKQVDRHTFLIEVWPRIKPDLEALESNWKTFKTENQPLLIHWGYINKKTKEKKIVAIQYESHEKEEYWIKDELPPNRGHQTNFDFD